MPKKVAMRRNRLQHVAVRALKKNLCPACAGTGKVCCETWAEVRAGAGEDLEFNELGIPLWPLVRSLEMARCPFCGHGFKTARAQVSGKSRADGRPRKP